MDQMGAQRAAVLAMKAEAVRLGIRGVACALILEGDSETWDPTFSIVGGYFRPADPARSDGDTGTNWAIVAWTKIVEMIETLANSGTTKGRILRKGELGYLGGLADAWNGGTFLFVAFSGATEQKDLLVATTGLEAMPDFLNEHKEEFAH